MTLVLIGVSTLFLEDRSPKNGDIHRFHFHIAHSKENGLGGGFKDFLFSPPFGEMIEFDEYVSKGLKPPTRNGVFFSKLRPFSGFKTTLRPSVDFHAQTSQSLCWRK